METNRSEKIVKVGKSELEFWQVRIHYNRSEKLLLPILSCLQTCTMKTLFSFLAFALITTAVRTLSTSAFVEFSMMCLGWALCRTRWPVYVHWDKNLSQYNLRTTLHGNGNKHFHLDVSHLSHYGIDSSTDELQPRSQHESFAYRNLNSYLHSRSPPG